MTIFDIFTNDSFKYYFLFDTYFHVLYYSYILFYDLLFIRVYRTSMVS